MPSILAIMRKMEKDKVTYLSVSEYSFVVPDNENSGLMNGKKNRQKSCKYRYFNFVYS